MILSILRLLKFGNGPTVVLDTYKEKSASANSDLRRLFDMKCPYCTVEISPTWSSGGIKLKRAYDDGRYDEEPWRLGVIIETAWDWQAAECPSCRGDIIFLNVCAVDDPESPLAQYQAYPSFTRRKNISDKVPAALKEEYEEACQVLQISPKASAALSRRILQAMLEERGYEFNDLAQEIVAAMNETSPDKILPNSIRQKIDAVRNVGNFAAHPMADMTTFEVINVEPKEAEWCLEIIEELFDHYYNTSYKEDKEQIALLNEKLRRANRKEVKS